MESRFASSHAENLGLRTTPTPHGRSAPELLIACVNSSNLQKKRNDWSSPKTPVSKTSRLARDFGSYAIKTTFRLPRRPAPFLQTVLNPVWASSPVTSIMMRIISPFFRKRPMNRPSLPASFTAAPPLFTATRFSASSINSALASASLLLRSHAVSTCPTLKKNSSPTQKLAS